MNKRITIGTRASKLAMIQTHMVIERLKKHWPKLETSIEQVRTRGDSNTTMPLTQLGSDGVFVTEIEQALHDGRIDLAVHSLKDLPTVQPAGLRIAVIGPREDVRDVLIFREFEHRDTLDFQEQLSRIAQPLRIGTCSLRRSAQVLALCPDAEILPLRGNVDTRLRKLNAGEYDAIVLAAAGLHRLDLAGQLAGRISYFPIDTMLPAPGQGALALEMRDDQDMLALIAPVIDPTAQAATVAERMFMRRLGAGCYLPVAAFGEISNETLELRGLVISLDGQRQVRVRQSTRWTAQTSIERAEALGITLAEEALARGADKIIREIDTPSRAPAKEPVSPKATPIQGKRILVTRSGEQAGALSEKLRLLGAIPLEFPTIRIVPPDDWHPLDDALSVLAGEPCRGVGLPRPGGSSYSWLIFTSANGVHAFFDRLRLLGYEHTALSKTRVAVIGVATQAALAQYGLGADLVPGEFVAESLVSALIEHARRCGETLAGQRVLLARAAEGRSVLPDALRQAGAIVDDVAVYRTLPLDGDDAGGQQVLWLLQEGQLDILTFTSSSTVRNFMQWLGKHAPLDAVKIACIGPVTAQTAREMGLSVHMEASESTIDGLIEAMLRYEERR